MITCIGRFQETRVNSQIWLKVREKSRKKKKKKLVRFWRPSETHCLNMFFFFFLMGQIFFFGWYSSDPDQELSGSKVLETLFGGGGGTLEEDKILLHSLIPLIRFWTKTAKAQL